MLGFRCGSCGGLNRVRDGAPGGKRPVCGRCKAALDAAAKPQAVDSRDLARAIAKSPVPVLVDFWAPWCGPCRTAAPLLEDIARQNAGEVIVLKVDIDQVPQASAAHGVRGVPTFIVFDGGKEVARQVGVPPGRQFHAWVEQHTS